MKLRYAAVLLALAIPVTACSSAPPQMTVNGTVTVEDNPDQGVYPPVQDGSQVTVTDASGKVIAVTGLNDNASVIRFALRETLNVREALADRAAHGRKGGR